MIRSVWIAILASLLLSACAGEEHSDIKQWMTESTKDLRGRVPPLPEVKPFPVVSYDAGGLLDPFQPAKIEPEAKPSGPGVKGPPELDPAQYPLIKYPLDALRFVGVLRKKGKLRAQILADKLVYSVELGHYMGQNFGKIVEIQVPEEMNAATLVLKETVQDASGEWTQRTTNVEMQVQEAKK